MKPWQAPARVQPLVPLVAAGLALLGCLFIRSATIDDPRFSGLHLKQLVVLGVATTSGVLLICIPYGRIMRRAWLWYGMAVVALLLLPFFGVVVNGARRWYSLPGVFIQPSEFAKLAVIVMLASYLRFRAVTRAWDGWIVPILITSVPAVLVLREPDLGSALSFGPVLLAMCYAAGAPKRTLTWIVLLGIIGMAVVYFLLHDYQRARMDTWWQHFDWTAESIREDPGVRDALRGNAYQPWQALIAVGSGGWFGFGLEHGPQNRYGFLPYQFDDYIFAVIAEETGFIGALGVLALQGLLVFLLLRVALRTRERFGRLLVVGVAAYFATQSLLHAAVCAWLVPATGLPMPLLSYGGSATTVSVWALALALNVSARREAVLGPDGFA